MSINAQLVIALRNKFGKYHPFSKVKYSTMSHY